jgi:hypothetical protein
MVVVIDGKKDEGKNDRHSTENLQHSPDNPYQLLVGVLKRSTNGKGNDL